MTTEEILTLLSEAATLAWVANEQEPFDRLVSTLNKLDMMPPREVQREHLWAMAGRVNKQIDVLRAMLEEREQPSITLADILGGARDRAAEDGEGEAADELDQVLQGILEALKEEEKCGE